MSSRLYVGNLPFHVTHEVITQRFIQCGEVKGVDVVLDRETGRSRGFAFVEMASPAAAEKAIAELDGQDLEGRPLRVSIAEDRRAGRNDRGGPRRGR
jgi:cold-inducible RNA-binding protein